MLGNQVRLVCAVASLVVLLGYAKPSVAQSATMNDICALLENGALISSGNSCNTYYSCASGFATLQTCPSNYYFNKDLQACEPQAEVNCVRGVQAPCIGYTVGTFAPMAGSCSGYYYCGGANGTIPGNCPSGLHFNVVTQKCEYTTDVPCISNGSGDVGPATVTLCDYIQNGVYFGSASSCSGWYICQNNILVSGTCPTGYNFNTLISKCDYPTNVKCSQVTHDPDLIGSPALLGGSCSTQGLTKAATPCDSFYRCNGTTYLLQQCNKGLYYDTVLGYCVDRMDARNNCDRCVDTTKSFVNMYSSTDCNGYLYCKNGVEVSTGFCPAGTYFDEVISACLNGGVQPSFGCCNPAVFGHVVPPSNGSDVPPPPNGSDVPPPPNGTS